MDILFKTTHKYIQLIATLCVSIIVLGCSDNKDDEPNYPEQDKIYAINLTSDTEDADLAVLASDGSYIIFDANKDKGYGAIYFNSSVGNDIDEGFQILVDNDGLPFMAKTQFGHLVFNFGEDAFDAALIDDNDNPIYVWNLPIEDNSTTEAKSIKSVRLNGFTKPFTQWLNNIDEHSIRMLVPYLCKVATFVPTAVSAVCGNPIAGLSIICSLFIEAKKSGLIDNNISLIENISRMIDALSLIDDSLDGGLDKYLKDGQLVFSAEGMTMGLLTSRLYSMADEQLQSFPKYANITKTSFESKEWQLVLGTNYLSCEAEPKTYRVSVTSRSLWEIDDSGVDKRWCQVSKDGGDIVVKILEYDDYETLSCKAVIKTVEYNDDVHPAILTISRTGLLFELSTDEITATQEGATRGIYVTTNGSVKEWSVSAHPEWCVCTRESGTNTLWVKINPDATLVENRIGYIDITAITIGGSVVTKSVRVVQTPELLWNNTSWMFTGSFTIDGDIYPVNFGISIKSVEENKFSFSGDLEGCEKYFSISLGDNNTLCANGKITVSSTGVYATQTYNINLKRDSADEASGSIVYKVDGTVDGEHFSDCVVSSLKGVRI